MEHTLLPTPPSSHQPGEKGRTLSLGCCSRLGRSLCRTRSNTCIRRSNVRRQGRRAHHPPRAPKRWHGSLVRSRKCFVLYSRLRHAVGNSCLVSFEYGEAEKASATFSLFIFFFLSHAMGSVGWNVLTQSLPSSPLRSYRKCSEALHQY